jgi:hypothetical protein
MFNWTVTNELCLSGGRYCSPDPDGFGPLLGRDVILEDLRQICLHRQSNEKWWQYMRRFSKTCLNPPNGTITLNLTECSIKIMSDLKFKVDKILFCVDSSFEGGDPLYNDSTILKE